MNIASFVVDVADDWFIEITITRGDFFKEYRFYSHLFEGVCAQLKEEREVLSREVRFAFRYFIGHLTTKDKERLNYLEQKLRETVEEALQQSSPS